MADELTEPTGSLYERTRALLREDKRTVYEVAVQSGLPFYWVRKLQSGEVLDPSVNRVQALYEFLTGSKLLDK